MSYVILSRITNIKQLHLKEFDPKKIYCSKVAKREAERLYRQAINKQETIWNTNNSNIVKISSLNARSLQQHYRDLQKDEFVMKSDIIVIQETWLEENPKEPITEFEEYYVNRGSKGISLFTRIKPNAVEFSQSATHSSIKVTYDDFDVINIYRFSDGYNLSEFTSEILSLFDSSRRQIVLGDMNIDLLKNPNNLFSQSLQQRGFNQIVNRPTHVKGGLIDHIYYYSPNNAASCSLYKYHTVFWSDHTCLLAILEKNSDC